tara:strand:- start:1812 stop:2081 length:270 start_codon:yes stop_codon:yes gene_type:complete
MERTRFPLYQQVPRFQPAIDLLKMVPVPSQDFFDNETERRIRISRHSFVGHEYSLINVSLALSILESLIFNSSFVSKQRSQGILFDSAN